MQFFAVAVLQGEDNEESFVICPADLSQLLLARTAEAAARKWFWRLTPEQRGRCTLVYVRGFLNEGGLFGERQGWHLPGFDTSTWVSRDLSTGLPGGSAGVGFFVTTFKLNIPAGIDAFVSFTFEEPLGQDYRLYLFVNGWMMGKRVANLG